MRQELKSMKAIFKRVGNVPVMYKLSFIINFFIRFFYLNYFPYKVDIKMLSYEYYLRKKLLYSILHLRFEQIKDK